MKKLALTAAVATILASNPAFAATWVGTAKSGTAADPLASISVNSGTVPTLVWYVQNSTGAASNRSEPAIQLTKQSDWTFDFTNLSAVTFTGSIVMGDYRTQTYVKPTPAANIDGRQSYTGATTSFSGTGQYNEATNTFTFSFLNPTKNGGGASTVTQTSSSCVNGQTAPVGKVCTAFATATKEWEGLSLNFVFNESRTSFAGTLTGTDTSGTGIASNTSTVNWQISGATPAVPVPAAAWLFGSGLVGLAGAARRRAKKA